MDIEERTQQVTSDELEQWRQRAANRRSKAESRQESPEQEIGLAAQRGRIAALQAREHQIGTLRERKRSLEVECIAAEAAVRTAVPGTRPDPDHGTASEIVQSLDRRRALEDTLTALDQRFSATTDAGLGEMERLRGAQDALRAWLEAPQRRDLEHARRPLRIVLVAAIVATIVAAITIHPVLLLLVLPLGPMSFLLRPGQDTEWRRMGAKQRFKESGLAGPGEWNERSVQSRVEELEAATDAASQQPAGPAAEHEAMESELTAMAAQLSAEDEHIATLLAEAGLDSEALLDEDFERRLRLLAQVHRSRHELALLTGTLKEETADADTVREGLRRYLTRQGETPSEGRADTTTLAAGLDRLADRGRKDGSE